MKTGTKHLIVVAGPTAIGKTDLAIKLGKHYHTEIISADSRQFYIEMNIGTAKPSKSDLLEVKHHFINHKHIHELYGAGHFAKEANEVLETLFISNEIVIVVGGSGLYIDALLNGVDEFGEVPLKFREELNEAFKQKGLTWLQEELKKVDEVYYKKVDINNPQRIIRALEIFNYTQKPYSSFLQNNQLEKKYNTIGLLINCEREKLYNRINERVDLMMKEGLLEEVKNLASQKDLNALKTVGYKELFDFLEGHCTIEYAIDKIKQHTRNYAKRQLTWFKNKSEFEEFEPHDFEKICAYIDVIVAHG